MQDKDKILRRIKKCLALSKSSNENEAAMALRQAKALMDAHGIQLDEARQPDFNVVDLSDGKRSRAAYSQGELFLYSIVADFFGCTVYTLNNWPAIIGVAPGPEIVRYAADTLLRQMRASRKLALEQLEGGVNAKLPKGMKAEFNRSYNMNWVNAVYHKVKDFSQSVSTEQKQAHKKAMEKHWSIAGEIKSRKFNNRKQTEISHYASYKGAADGSRAELNHGIGSSAQKSAMLGAVLF